MSLSSSDSKQNTSNNHDRYGGMIKESYFKIIKRHLYGLFTYLDSVVPNFFPMHEVVTFWRMLQFIGPCLCAACSALWDTSKASGRAVSIISIFCHIIPVPNRRDGSVIFEFIYCGINIIFFIMVTISAFYYKKYAKLPTHLPSILSIYIHTLGYLMHPINLNLVGEDLGRLIDGQSLKLDIAIEIISIVLSLVCFAVWFWFFDQISIVSFFFRPNSLLSVLSSTQTLIVISTNAVTFVLALASQLKKYPSGILTIAGASIYLAGFFSVYTAGSYIKSSHKKLVFSTSIVSCAFTIVMGVYILCEKKGSFLEILILICVFILVYLLSGLLLKKRIRSQIQFLDDYQNKVVTIDDINTPKLAVKLGITCMEYAHPSCYNWAIFRQATEKWPTDVKLWVTFGKFVAIYPTENQLLSQIIYTMAMNNLKGNLAKQTIEQAKTIYTQRESSLSPELKVKLNKGTKNVQVTKRKLRHIWDLAIQGSINEMETSINAAYNSVNKARSFYNHLLSQYPNNRFVARSYLRFINEIEFDPQKSEEWSNKVSHLHRGIPVNSDRTNLLGIHAFPNLPPTVGEAFSQQSMTESESFISENETIDDNNANQSQINAQISIIRDHIEHLSIPATRCIKLWNIFLFLVLILLPSVIMMIMLPNYLNSLSKCLYYEYHLSYLRALSIEVPVFANHYLCERIQFYPKPLFNMAPEAYGSKDTTDEMLRFLLAEMTVQVQEINEYRSFKKDNKDVHLVHNIIFGGVMPYQYYVNATTSYIMESTLQGSLTDVALSSARLLDEVAQEDCENDPEKCWEYQGQTDFLNPYRNYGMICDNISTALNTMNQFLFNNYNNMQNTSICICLFICIVYALIILGILVYQINLLEKCKKSIYKCLTALPKNVVSSISESLKMMNKVGDDEEDKAEEIDSTMNKQDENILKIFSSSGDASSLKSFDKTVLVVASFFLCACALIITCILALSFPQIASKLYNNSPQLGFILGTSAFGFSSIGALDNLILVSNNRGITGKVNYQYQNPNDDPESVRIRDVMRDFVLEKLVTFTNYYHYGRYGGDSNDIPAYSLYEDAVTKADSIIEGCEYDKSLELKESPKYYSCYNSDIQMNIFKPTVLSILIPITDGYATEFDPSNDLVAKLWNMMTIGICSKLLYPMFGNIVPEMQQNLNAIIPPAQTGVVIVLIVAFIVVVIIIYQIFSAEKKMRFSLSLLSQCPANVVLQTPSIMEILSGDFASKMKNVSTHNSHFFDSIVQSIPDSVIVCTSDYKVTSVNKATERIYNINRDEFIGKNAKEYFTTCSNFKDSTAELFEGSGSEGKIEFQSDDNDNKCFLKISVSRITNHIVIVTRDETQAVLYNTLIREERAKSDHLLSSILPPNLVKRVQEGEKNISFGVQSATILFLDIVEFTPWCASNTAAMVMSTLNALFRIFDANLATHETMTKIKCIGDCYMCAGGIFVEINQPSVHAKETVEFGLEAITAVEENNKDMNLSLRIRVGINTGGPIVAGVLGTEKPTFEILGPAINMSQQMEHHGVPMKVHVSRSTYELIYGGSFVIKERGQIEIKKGSVLTYLVESKK